MNSWFPNFVRGGSNIQRRLWDTAWDAGFTEPVLRRNGETVLEKGMILAVEPQRLHWHLQDLILINDGPPRLLSTRFSTDRPFVVEC
jgi:Xaa-Pro aminopeptidase